MTGAVRTGLRSAPASPAEDDRLRRCLEEEAVPRTTGRKARVVEVRRSPSPWATSYGAEVVAARLADGTELRLFLKDYGSSRRPRPAPTSRRERELAVYRDLIGHGELGTARYRGAVWDDRAALHWLLLELVPGTPLRQLELTLWIEAARWLGRFQGRFAQAPTAELAAALERHDAGFFAGAAERARSSVARYPTVPLRRLERILAPHETALEHLAGREEALVHGHFGAANIVVDADASPVRVCPVDWEQAALGSRLFDLASLCDGFAPPELHRIWDAYGEAAAEDGLETPEREELRLAVDRLRLHRVVAWLGSAVEKRYPPAGVEKLLERGEELACQVES